MKKASTNMVFYYASVFYKFRREIAIHAFGQSREIDGDHFQEELFPMIDK